MYAVRVYVYTVNHVKTTIYTINRTHVYAHNCTLWELKAYDPVFHKRRNWYEITIVIIIDVNTKK